MDRSDWYFALYLVALAGLSSGVSASAAILSLVLLLAVVWE